MLYGLILLQSTITLGPAALSYPELAQALTKAGMPCAVSPALSERGAYVHLKARSPESTRRILGEALGVAFREEEKGWRMVVDPEAKERERRFLLHYRRQAVEAARTWAGVQKTTRNGRSYLALRAWADTQVPVAKAMPLGDSGGPKAFEELYRAYTALTLASWFGAQALRDSTLVGNALERPQGWTIRPEDAARSLGCPLDRLSLGETKTILALRLGFRYDLERGCLTIAAHGETASGPETPNGPATITRPWNVIAQDWSASGDLQIDTEVPLEARTLEETFDRMGPRAKAALAGFVPTASLPEEPVGKEPTSRSLSSLLERLDLEAAMELSPRFEETRSGTPLDRFTLRSLFTLAKVTVGAYPAPAWLESLLPPDRWSQAFRARAFPWRTVQRDGVWIVADPIAFLDRLQPISPVPYLKIERVLRGLPKDAPIASWSSGDRLPDWKSVCAMAQAVPPGVKLDRYGYRGVASNLYGDLLPVARYVETTIPKTQHAALWKAAESPGGARWETQAGVFTLVKPRSGVQPDSPPVAHVEGRWQGADGSFWMGDGYIDARGLGDTAR